MHLVYIHYVNIEVDLDICEDHDDCCHSPVSGTRNLKLQIDIMVDGVWKNLHAAPTMFHHFDGMERRNIYRTAFQTARSVEGFGVKGRVTLVDQEKSIDCPYKEVMNNSSLFLKFLHVKMKLALKLDPKNQEGIGH